MTSEDVRTIAQETIRTARSQGQTISVEKEEAIIAIAETMPTTVREHTQAILYQVQSSTEKIFPIGDDANKEEQNAFYNSLIPKRRSGFKARDLVPHRKPAWELVQLVGTGGFGEVWQAQHPVLPQKYAVKFCLEERSIKSLKREATALCELQRKLPDHPNIVKLIDLNLEEAPYWLAFEFIEGGTLEALIQAKSCSWQETLSILQPLIAGMAAVHTAGIVHRDLKPANILLTKDIVAKVTDFGIGKIISEKPSKTTTFTRFGTFMYMSPEQRAGGYSAHTADDVYALAIILWQMLTGSLDAPDFIHDEIGKLSVPPLRGCKRSSIFSFYQVKMTDI